MTLKRSLFALFALLWLSVAFALPIAVPPGATITVSVTSSSAATALPSVGSDQVRQIELQNAGSGTVFVEFGDSTVAATLATGYPVLVGQSKVVTIKATATHIAAIDASGTQTLYVTVGIGE